MNKKDVLEIRKQFSNENCTISRICGCYVDGEKEKKLEFKEAFLSLPEDEIFKYYELFKKTLSGTMGKNLINMEFPLNQELNGGTQEFLLKLRASRLTDDMLLEEFYDNVIENYDFGEHYLILLIHAAYDIPGKSKDGLEMFDASDSVYEYVLCSICPVALSKAGLCYNALNNSIEDRIRDWIVNPPANGFLFPAFEERETNLHSMLYYSKKPEELKDLFIENVLGCKEVMTAKTQKESFQNIVSSTLDEECDYTVIKSIHDNLNEMIERNKEEDTPLELGKHEVKRLLTESGVPTEKLEHFEKDFEENTTESNSFLATNITDTRKFDIKTADVSVKVSPDRTDLVEIQTVNGRQCLVIPIEGMIEVNGMPVNAK